MIKSSLFDKYKPHICKEFKQQTFINYLFHYTKNYQNTEIYASNLILGDTGSGKSYLVNKIFNDPSRPYYCNLKTLDLIKLKKQLKYDTTNLPYEKKIIEYLKKYYLRSDISAFFTGQSMEKSNTVLYFDNNNQVFKPAIKKLLVDIININNKKRLCPILITFIDSQDQYLKQYKNNSNIFIFKSPTNNDLIEYTNKVLKGEKITMDSQNVETICSMCYNNYGILNNELNELFNKYTTNILKGRIRQSFISDEQFKKYLSDKSKNKYSYDNIIQSCEKSLTGQLNNDSIMQIFYKEKINYPGILSNYVLCNCHNLKSFMHITKILAFSDKINENIFKEQKWNLMHHYGFLSCIDLIHNFIQAEPTYKFKELTMPTYKNHKEHNHVFYSRFNSTNTINNLYFAQIIYHALKDKNKQMITNIIQKYKLSYHDMIYILKINKMSFYYRITNADLTLIKNIIDKYLTINPIVKETKLKKK